MLNVRDTDAKTCNVMDYGAKGDGVANDTTAILDAINDCGKKRTDNDASILLFPSDYSFKTSPFSIDGSQSSLISWTISGSQIMIGSNSSIINGVTDPNKWPSNKPPFIHLSYLSNFMMTGVNQGYYKSNSFKNLSVINGSGQGWWDIRKNDPSHFAPKLIIFQHNKNITINGLTLQNSPEFHLDISDCSYIYVSNMTIMAPKNSPNTDAMDISGDNAFISDCYLATGDDNIAIKPNAYNMSIKNVYCGHGHGTSIGSIGENNSTGYAQNIIFENVIYDSTTNVARIKTWQGGKGAVTNITYKNIEFNNVENPILINQYYCPSSQHSKPCHNSTINVNISHILFENFNGYQTQGHCGQFECSDSVPCDDINLNNITIMPQKSGGKNEWGCWEVEHSKAVDVNPPIKSGGNCNW